MKLLAVLALIAACVPITAPYAADDAQQKHMDALWLQVALSLRAEMAVAYVCKSYGVDYDVTKMQASSTASRFNFDDQADQMVAQYERENLALLATKPAGWPVGPLNKTNCAKQYGDAVQKESVTEGNAWDFFVTFRCFTDINC